MTEGDPAILPALYLDHVAAGVEKLEGLVLDAEDRNMAGRLALRLVRLARRSS